MPVDRSEIAAIVTAAGRSQRMGRPKALLDWLGLPLIVHQCRRLAGCGQVVVVTGCHEAPIAAALADEPGVTLAHNPAWEAGRSTSLEAGARAVAGAPRALLVTAVDQPLVTSVLDALLAAFDPARWDGALPTSAGRAGHPVLLSGALLGALGRVRALDEGLRSLVRAHRARFVDVPVGDAPIRWDLNTPEAYAAALARAGEG